METSMASGKELWESAAGMAGGSSAKSANALRFFALGKMLAEAESAALMDRNDEAVEHLRELQAHCEKLIAIMAPDKKGRPNLVAA